MAEELIERLAHGDRRALARVLTLLSRGQLPETALQRLPPSTPARVVAVTGSGGVGKSTLVGRLLDVIRKAGQSVAVLACDPQSPLSGGALLGDRFRMPSAHDDAGVYIRSLATPGGQGAVVAALPEMVRVLEAAGFGVVLIETVGAGQGDVAVRERCDVLVLLLQPETGDDLQWEKAGVMEVADLLVIHKADLPGADALEGQVKTILGLGNRPAPPVVRVSSRTGAGLAELWQAILACPLRRQAPAAEQELLRLGQRVLAERFAVARVTHAPALEELTRRWQAGALSPSEAGAALCALLGRAEQ